MKLIVNLKLKPLESQAKALISTLEKANQAANWISEQAFQNKILKQFNLHKLVYHPAKERFNLTAQMVVRVIAKVADSYKIQTAKQTTFRKHGSIAYDDRIIRFKSNDSVNIWTLQGRQTIPFQCGEYQRKLLPFLKGEVDLIYRKGNFYLNAVCDIPDNEAIISDDFLGVDAGIINLATDSTGEHFTGKEVERRRNNFANIKSKLQQCGSKSAKRHLKRLSGKQRAYQRNENHCIAKQLVKKAKAQNCHIALENLSGIRDGVTVRKSQKARIANWSFYGLQTYISYKAKREGIRVAFVDPRNTSRQCSKCLHTEKSNRKTQCDFVCKSCGFALNADHNAAINIKFRASSDAQRLVKVNVATSC